MRTSLKLKVEKYERISGGGMAGAISCISLAIICPIPILSPFLVASGFLMYIISFLALFVVFYFSQKLMDFSLKNIDFKEQIFHLENYVFGYFRDEYFVYPKLLSWGFAWEKIKVKDGFFMPFQKEVVSVKEGDVIAKFGEQNITDKLEINVYNEKEEKEVLLNLDFSGVFTPSFKREMSLKEWFEKNDCSILYKGLIYKLKGK